MGLNFPPTGKLELKRGVGEGVTKRDVNTGSGVKGSSL